MGLDVYFHIVRKPRSNKKSYTTVAEYNKLNDKRAKDKARKVAKRVLAKLKDAEGNKEEYTNVYNNVFIPKVEKLTKYVHRYAHMKDEVKPYDEVKTFWKHFVDWQYAEEDGYFRKVNFVYRYFEDKLEDECCFVSRYELEDLVERCDKVMTNPRLAHELLPTRSGFFFGSTDYDKWYFEDVKYAKEVFSSLLEKYNEDTDVLFVIMSW